MECPRCQGLMMREQFEDLRDDTGQMKFHGWHCLSCGEILDQVIVTNRRQQPKPIRHRNRNLFAYR